MGGYECDVGGCDVGHMDTGVMCFISPDVFRYDNEFLENEERYKAIKEGTYRVMLRIVGVVGRCGYWTNRHQLWYLL